MNEIEKLNAICFLLIKTARDTDSESMKMTLENVSFLGENIGTWEITVKKV